MLACVVFVCPKLCCILTDNSSLHPLGSVFQLASGSPPPLGSAATAVIAVIGVPSCIFLLYAAILKGIAETEEDDKAFLSGK